MKITYGANQHEVEAGKTIAEIRGESADILNLPEDAKAMVDGKEVAEDFIPEGDIEFIKEAGDKG